MAWSWPGPQASPDLERRREVELWQAVREAVSVPVVAGTGTASTAHSVELTKAAAAGVDGVLAVTPYYNRPSQAGIEAHFRAIAGRLEPARHPLRHPQADGPGDARRRCAPGPRRRHRGVKDATGRPPTTAALVAAGPPSFEVYSGDDALTLPLLAVGAVGAISVASHWAGPEMSEMVARSPRGTPTPHRAERPADPVVGVPGHDAAPNPVPTKAMLRSLGLPSGRVPPPDGPDAGRAGRAGPTGLGRPAR